MKLEERKMSISKEIMHKYENAIFKANDKMRVCKDQSEHIGSIGDYYRSLLDKLNSEEIIAGSDSIQDQVDILNQIPELDKFIYENTLKIKTYLLS